MQNDHPNRPANPPRATPANPKKRELLIEQLEDRVLFDAVPIAPMDVVDDPGMDVSAFVQSSNQVAATDSMAATDGQEVNRREVVFVDKGVEDYQSIVADFVANHDVEVFLLNGQSSGLQQMLSHLEGRTDIDAIHIVSHGSNGALRLGNSTLTADNLTNDFARELVRVGQSLSDSGDILIYGCELAESSAGESFVQTFSDLTSADVAASDDLTGNAEQGGDWELERHVGSVEAVSLVSEQFKGTLIETDAGFIIGTETLADMTEIAVTPLSQGGTSSRMYANAATANGGTLSIDVQLTLVDTFDENGNVTTGTASQMPLTFSNFVGAPIILSRDVGVSLDGFQGHTAHIVVEFFNSATGNPLSVVGDFTFKDIDYIGATDPDTGKGAEAVTVVSDQVESYQISSNPVTSIVTEDNGDGTTTFTNYTTNGGEDDEERWVSAKFHNMPQLNLRFQARGGNTGYGLSTANFTATPISFSQPIAQDDDFTTDQNSSINGNVVTANNGNGVDSDPDNDPLEVYLINGDPAGVGTAVAGSTGGLFTINADGTYTFNPNGEYDDLTVGETATTTIQYTVKDYTGLASTATVTVVIEGTNDAPIASGTIPPQTDVDNLDSGSLDVSTYFSDADTSDTLTFSAANLPPGLTIDPDNGIITGVLDNSASVGGPYNVVITASDGTASATRNFTWTVTNPGPTATNNSGSVNENSATETGNIITDNDGSGTDSDPDGDALTVSNITGGTVDGTTPGSFGSVVINGDGTYTYTLDNNNPTVNALDGGDSLTETFTYTVSDGEGGTDTATLTITINGTNDAPILGGTIPSQSDMDDDTVTAVDVSAAFSDPEGDTLTYSVVGLPAGLSIHPTTGLITGQLDNSASQNAPGGVHSITVTATDDGGANISTTFTWTVGNPGPDAVNDNDSTTQSALTGGNVMTGSDSDPDGDSISVNAVDGVSGNLSSTVTGTNGGEFIINSDGSYSFDPNGAFDSLAATESATTSVTYTITDSEGGTDTATLTVTVNGTNDDPTPVGTIPPQANVDGTFIPTLDVSPYFTDVDSTDVLTFSAIGLPTGLSINTTTGEITGSIDNSASLNGPYTVEVSVNDGNGGTTMQSFTWAVTNPGPATVNDSGATDQDTNATGNVIVGSDSDPDGDTITVNSVNGNSGGVSTPVAGTNGGEFTINSDGSYTFNPDGDFDSLAAGQTATTTVTYEITDSEGGFATATLEIEVTGTNDDPTPVGMIPNQANLDSDPISNIDVSGFFADTDSTDTLTFSSAGLPAGLSIHPTTGVISGLIDHSASQTGPYTVTITADDRNGGEVEQTFTWTVTNPGPTATDNNNAVTAGANTPALGNIISDNDGSGVDSDPDGDSLTVDSVSGGTVDGTTNGNFGEIVINNDGTYTYTLDENNATVIGLNSTQSVTEAFDYTVTDSEGGTSTATLTITVNGANEQPITGGTIPPQADLDNDTVAPLDVSTYFSDPDGDTLTFSAAGLPNGLSINPTTGEITGNVDPSASQDMPGGVHSIIVTATDPSGELVSTTFTWTITNPAPTATDNTDDVTAGANTSATGNIISDNDGSGVDSDPDGDTLTVDSVAGGTVDGTTNGNFGDIVINNDGTYTYTLDENNASVVALNSTQTLTETFDYTVSDGEGGTSTATLTITVNGTNDQPVTGGTIPPQADFDNDTVAPLDASTYFSDPDGDTLTYSAAGLPNGLSINPTTGEITGDLDPSASQDVPGGVHSVTVTATDPDGETVSTTFTWTVANPGPSATDNINDVTAGANTAATGNIINDNDGHGQDSDPDGDLLTVSQVAGGTVDGTTNGNFGDIVINNDGTYTYTLDENNASVIALSSTQTLTETFDYTVNDGEGGTSTATLTITINGTNEQPVTGGTIPPQADLDNETVAPLDVSTYFSDPDGDMLTYSAAGLPNGLSINPTTGEITGDLNPSASQDMPGGVHSVTVTATDPDGETVSTTFTWTVTNPGPSATDNINDVTAGAHTAATGNIINDDDGHGQDSDPDGDLLTVSQVAGGSVDGTTNGSFGDIVINNDGTYTYTLDENNASVVALNSTQTLTETFDYTVNDGEGGTSTATLTITVNGTNDQPVTGGTIPPQADLDNDNVAPLDVSTYFSDPDGDTLTYSAAGLPNGLSINPTTGEITGDVDPSASQDMFGGVHTVTITATDPTGSDVSTTFEWTISNPAPIAQNDSFSTQEDTSITASVVTGLGADSDPDGDALTFTQATSASNGNVNFNPDGSFTYIPDADFAGVDSFDYLVTDADGATSTATVTIDVTPVNDAPTSQPIPNRSNFDSDNPSVDVSGSFSDVEGDTLTYSANGLPTGLSIDSATGIISGPIDSSASQNGAYSVTVVVEDGNGGSTSETFTWTIANPAPTAIDDTNSTMEGTAVSGTVAPNDFDVDGDTLSFALATQPANGTVALDLDGTYTYTPLPDFNGVDSFTYTTTDVDGATATATVTITVDPENDAPVVGQSIPNQADLDSDAISLDVSGNFSDVDGDSVTFTATGLPNGLSIDPATGIISGTIDSSASTNGPYSVTVLADDGNGGVVPATFTWTVDNPVPVAQDDTETTDEDTTVSGTVVANDSDADNDSLVYTQTSNPANGQVNFSSDGSFTYTPDPDFFGTDSFDYMITDADGATSVATVTITINPVNDNPNSNPIPDQSDFDSDLVSVDVSPSFSDIEGDTLTFSASGLPTGLSIDPATGIISGPLDSSASASGPYTVTVNVADGNGGLASETFGWTVANPAPDAVNDSYNTNEDVPVNGDASTNDSDPDGDTTTYVQTTNPSNGMASMGTDGTFTYTPNLNFSGVDTFDYEVTDADGTISTATVTIIIGDVNDPPVVDTPLPDLVNEDIEIISLDVSGNFSDAEGATLNFSATGLPPGLSIDPATGIISGTIDNSASTTGPYNVTITADDGDVGGTVSDTFIWTITNPAPTAINDANSVTEDVATTAIGNIVNNDSDPDGDDLSVAAVDGSAADVGATISTQYGSLLINPDGSYEYTLDPNNPTVQALDIGETLSETFTYQVSDGEGGTANANLTITIDGTNDAPESSTIPNETNFDDDSPSVDISGYFSDIENDTLMFAATGLPSGLSIDPATGIIAGDIDIDASTGGPTGDGVYSVSVTATDDIGDLTTTSFTWTVDNPVPVATDDSFTTDEDVLVVSTLATNDSDADNDALTFTLLGAGPADGTLNLNSDGSFDYLPDANFYGTDTFEYTLTDADGDSSTATVTITVDSVNDIPVVDSPIADQADLDSDVISVDVANNFSDIEGPLTFAASGLPAGLSISPTTGEITGPIDSSASVGGPNSDGNYSVDVTVTDSNGATTTDSFVWTVANPAPNATNDNFSTDEDITLTDSVANNDNDPDNDVLTYSLVGTGTSNGMLNFNDDGSFDYVPDPGFNGSDTFDYMITDVDGATSIATATIGIGAVNDAPVILTPLEDQADADADSISLDISGSFDDPDGDSLTFSATGLPPGLSIAPLTGIISGSLPADASDPNPFAVTVTVVDGNGGIITETFNWVVVNPAPTAVDDSYTTLEDTPVNGNAAVNDSDIDGDLVTYTQSSLPSNGFVTFNDDGSFTYTPNMNFTGSDSFTYAATDADGDTATATVDIVITPVNDVPAVVNPLENQDDFDSDVISVDVTSAFTDVESPTLTYAATGLPPGLSIDPASGLITGTIDSSASVNGTYAVSVAASDPEGETVSSDFVWTVNNPIPVAVDDNYTTAEDTDFMGSVATNDIDPDGDAIEFTVTTEPSNGIVTMNPDGTFTYTPNANFTGTDTFEYEVTDADGATTTATATIDITPVNDPPVVTQATPDQSNFDADNVSVNVTDAFEDVDNSLTFAVTGLPAGLSFDPATGLVTGAVDPGESSNGPFTVTVTADDGDGGVATDTFTWTVDNIAPIAVDDLFSTDEDVTLSATVATNDSDPDGDAVTYKLLPGGTNNGMLSFNPDGSFIYIPDANFVGQDTFDYEICDDDGDISTATAIINVGPVNDPPVVDSPITDQVNIDNENIVVDISSNFSEPEGDNLTFSATGLPPGLVIDPVTGIVSGTIDSSASQGGPYTVVVTAADPLGSATSDTFTWSVSNPGPTATNDSYSGAEDQQVNGSVLGNDSDPDNDTLTTSVVSQPPNGTVTMNPDGTFVYTPDAGFFGTDTFVYEIVDADGAVDTAIVTINLKETVHPPVATDDIEKTNEDTPVNVNVLTNDSDDNGDPLTVSLGTEPFNGTVVLNPDGTITYTPDADFNGTDSFTYQISDGNGGTDVATVNITVDPVNDPPVAVNDLVFTAEDTPINGTLVPNSTDPDSPVLTYTLVTPPHGGTVSVAPDGTFVFTPNPNFNGPTTFEFEVCDEAGLCDTAVVTINVSSTQDPPVANPDAGTTDQNLTLIVDLLNNDSDPDNDPIKITEIEGTPISVGQTVELPSGALVTLNADQTISFNPNGAFDDLPAGQNAVDVFEYVITDSSGETAVSQVMVTVAGINDAPVAVDDNIETTIDNPVTIDVLGTDSDPDSDPLTVILLEGPINGTAVVNDDSSITFTPDSDFEGEVTILYLVEDPHGATSQAEVRIAVKPQFAFDAFNDFSQNELSKSVGGVNHHSEVGRQKLSQKIFSLAPEPIFSGFARPGTQIVGRIYDASGALIGDASAMTDPGGNWMMQFSNAKGHEFYRIEFEQVATSSLEVYGYFGLDSSNNSYQAMEALTAYDQPLSVENAMETSQQTLEALHRIHNNPFGFGQ